MNSDTEISANIVNLLREETGANPLHACAILVGCLGILLTMIERDSEREDLTNFFAKCLPEQVKIYKMQKDKKLTDEEAKKTLQELAELVKKDMNL